MIADCNKYLTNDVIGCGSSRIVYQIDDKTVLKLAGGEAGKQQNKQEYLVSNNDNPIFAQIFKTDKDFNWITSEYVLSANTTDFNEIFGFDFNTFIGVIMDMVKGKNVSNYINNDKTYFFKHFYDYMIKDYEYVDDLYRIDSYGITQRNNKLSLVILDSGLSCDI